MKQARRGRGARSGSSSDVVPGCFGEVRMLLQLATAFLLARVATSFVADVPGMWPRRSSTCTRGSTTSACPCHNFQASRTVRWSLETVYGVQHERSGSSSSSKRPWSSRGVGTRLWVAGKEQRQGVAAATAKSTIADNTTGATGSTSSSSSSSSSSSDNVKQPVLPVVGDITRVNMDALRVRSLSGEGDEETSGSFVDLFRGCAPYIRAHLGAIMVIHMGGEVVEDPNFPSIMDDLGLLRLLGARLVIVTGARPQMSTLLQQAGIKEEFRDNLRVTSKEALKVIKAAAGFVRIEVESALSRGARGGTAGDFHVAGGNFFSAQPVGVRDGVDYGCTGEVRKVEADRIRAQLNEGGVVHLTCIGYSGSGEVFNVNSVDLAAKCAASVGASKLIYIADGYLEDSTTGEIINSMRLSEARSLLSRYEEKKIHDGEAATAGSGAGAVATADLEKDVPPAEVEMVDGVAVDEEAAVGGGGAGDVHGVEQRLMRLTERAVMALTRGVSRAHVVPPTSGALLQELYTRDGAGLLISRDIYDGIRPANPIDIPGIREIIVPLEKKGILVPRTPEQLEADISQFFVITRDETVLGVAFFKRYGQDHAEVGCLAIHRDYRKRGWGEAMLSYLERVALASSVKHLFVLSTVTMQWFVERGFRESQVSDLPPERRESYNWERMSKIYHKTLGGGVRAVDAEELLWDVRGMI
ncbi:unnamed protein product [Ectocarpus sp. 4 AP-2014]